MGNVDENNTDKKKNPHNEREEKVLKFWSENQIFEKSVKKEAPCGEFTFYDGPPFATGTPHYGHLLAGTIKDVIPRWKTMQGYRVRRRWGWDCHGLPVENLIEKDLKLSSKKDIIDFGIGKFNEFARGNVMRYADLWRKIVPRLGRWVDMEHDYRTMDASYTETVWWIFKQLYDKGLIYQGFKSMNLCPHCETTLSNFEVALGYRDITDISVYAKFKVKGKEGTYFLAWTTTPWTLPGNVALAVNPSIEYVKVRISEGTDEKKGDFILAKERLAILKDSKYEVIETVHGSRLIGIEYEPLFDIYAKNESLNDRQNGWKVYGADFVTTSDGTGIVHIAPAFGADDYDLSSKFRLPFVQHVNIDGTIKSELSEIKTDTGTSFAGMRVKPKDSEEDRNAHQKTDIEIIKWLSHRGMLFDKEKLIHSYPHCWRCETPLLNYASSSWFVRVTEFKDKLVAENKKITWVPSEIGESRFGNWLEGARDWAISRSRFWGAPIPVWVEKTEGDTSTNKNRSSIKETCHIIGSVADLKKYSKAKNTYYMMRHGEAENNIRKVLNFKDRDLFHLTTAGREQVKKSAEGLKDAKIDLIYVSPMLRAQETAKIVAEKLGLGKEKIMTDDRLSEFNMGILDGHPSEELTEKYPTQDRFEKYPEGGESYAEIRKRMASIVYELESMHEGKTILLVTHETPGYLLISAVEGLDNRQTFDMPIEKSTIKNAEVRKLDFVPLPHNADFVLDLHRPYIDKLDLKTEGGIKLERVPDVFDCWFESGSMPYAKAHYPFDVKKDKLAIWETEFDPKSSLLHKPKGFPADFIAEGLDQTRGWFYSMLVLGVALFGRSPYKKVIVNGLVLAEDGEKMSKSKQNFPDPMLLVEKYCADSLRFYMLSSPVVRAQDLCFSEKGVDEVTKKVVNRLLNVVSFFELYSKGPFGPIDMGMVLGSNNILDKWIYFRLNGTVQEVTKYLESGELDRATRQIVDFVDDLSTWYIRRSRDRFKGEDEEDKSFALAMTRFVLIEISKILAPFMPFLAEDIYARVGGTKESVHLELWPEGGKVETSLMEEMIKVRKISSLGLEARMVAKINVRQPLQTLKMKTDLIASQDVKREGSRVEELVRLIKDEVNVKDIVVDYSIENDVELDTTMSDALKEEGMRRELVRAVQDLRKEKGLTVNNRATLKIETDSLGKEFVGRFKDELKKATLLEDVNIVDTGIFSNDKNVKESGVTMIGDFGMKLTL